MRPYLFLVLSLVIISAIIIVGFPTPPDFLNEGAFVETSSVVLYGVTITFLLWLRPMKELKDTLLCAAVTLCLMLRELDFDKKFTDLGVFKGKFYKSAEIPIIQKLIGLFIILTLLALVITLLVRHTKPLLRGLKENHRAKYGVITAIILAFVSKAFLDGMPRKVAYKRSRYICSPHINRGSWWHGIHRSGWPPLLVQTHWCEQAVAGRTRKMSRRCCQTTSLDLTVCR